MSSCSKRALREWPPGLAPYRLRGLSPSPNLRLDQIKALRSKNGMTSYTLSDGHTYCAVGGGHSAAGTSIPAVIEADRWRHRIRQREAGVRENFAAFCAQVEALGVQLPQNVVLHLGVDDDTGELHAQVEGHKIRWSFEAHDSASS